MGYLFYYSTIILNNKIKNENNRNWTCKHQKYRWSDNECNIGNSYESYKEYVQKVGNPYVYSIDLCGYGTTQLVGERVKYLYGYGLNIFNDILNSEFNAEDHLDKVKQIKFK